MMLVLRVWSSPHKVLVLIGEIPFHIFIFVVFVIGKIYKSPMAIFWMEVLYETRVEFNYKFWVYLNFFNMCSIISKITKQLSMQKCDKRISGETITEIDGSFRPKLLGLG
jgi:hypothetical protein